MALYIGYEKVKIILDGVPYKLNLCPDSPIETDARLLSSDGYVLTDLNGTYLIPKEV